MEITDKDFDSVEYLKEHPDIKAQIENITAQMTKNVKMKPEYMKPEVYLDFIRAEILKGKNQ